MGNDSRSAEVAIFLRTYAAGHEAGSRVPSSRELRQKFGASPVTIARAVAELCAEGTLYTEAGRGTYVAARTRLAEADYAWQSVALGRPRVDGARASRLGGYGTEADIPLSWGYLASELQPRQLLQSSAARVVKRAAAWDIAPPAGIPELRRVFAAEFRTDPANVLVMPGGQQAISFAMRVLTEPGSPILMESPSYPGAIIAAQAAGLNPVAVPCDDRGIVPHLLEECLIRTGARLLYLQPTYANPTGVSMPPDRRHAVLGIMRAHGAFILEDDWARQLGLDEPLPPPLFIEDRDGHVVTCTSLSKPAAPSLRVGAIIARGPAGERLRNTRISDDMCVPRLLQETALELITAPQWRTHMRRLHAELRLRRDRLCAEIRRSFPAGTHLETPKGGLHVWVRMPADVDATELSEAARLEGILVGNGDHFFVDEAPAPFLRMSFGSAAEEQIAEAVPRLAVIMERLRHNSVAG